MHTNICEATEKTILKNSKHQSKQRCCLPFVLFIESFDERCQYVQKEWHSVANKNNTIWGEYAFPPIVAFHCVSQVQSNSVSIYVSLNFLNWSAPFSRSFFCPINLFFFIVVLISSSSDTIEGQAGNDVKMHHSGSWCLATTLLWKESECKMQMCSKSQDPQTNFNLRQEKQNATENSKQSIYVRLDWVCRWLHHVAPCNAMRDDWYYTIRIWLTQPSGTADHFVRGPELFRESCFLFWELFLDLLFGLFSMQFAAFWSWKLPSQR